MFQVVRKSPADVKMTCKATHVTHDIGPFETVSVEELHDRIALLSSLIQGGAAADAIDPSASSSSSSSSSYSSSSSSAEPESATMFATLPLPFDPSFTFTGKRVAFDQTKVSFGFLDRYFGTFFFLFSCRYVRARTRACMQYTWCFVAYVGLPLSFVCCFVCFVLCLLGRSRLDSVAQQGLVFQQVPHSDVRVLLSKPENAGR